MLLKGAKSMRNEGNRRRNEHAKVRAHTRACGLSRFVKSTIMRNRKRYSQVKTYT